MTETTKRVRIEQGIASSEDWSYAPGQVVDLPVAQADAWIASGVASPAAGRTAAVVATPETAAIEPTETTALPRGRKHPAGR